MQQHLEKGTFQLQPPGTVYPQGTRFLPLKRHCKLKSGDVYKVRWVVLGNLGNFGGDTFSPTASKKVVWLLFAVGVLLNLTWQWFDVEGAFMAEKPTRADLQADLFSVWSGRCSQSVQ